MVIVNSLSLCSSRQQYRRFFGWSWQRICTVRSCQICDRGKVLRPIVFERVMHESRLWPLLESGNRLDKSEAARDRPSMCINQGPFTKRLLIEMTDCFLWLPRRVHPFAWNRSVGWLWDSQDRYSSRLLWSSVLLEVLPRFTADRTGT